MMMDKKTMMNHCRNLRKTNQKMMEQMKAQDADLARMVAEMKKAPEDRKVSIMADILEKMVSQRANRHKRMERKRDNMMRHMMMHMRAGSDWMTECPVLKAMMDNGTPVGDKEEQTP